MSSDNITAYRIKQDGMIVAGVEGTTDKVKQEILHYAFVYGLDGPVTIQRKLPGSRWKTIKEGDLQ